MKNTRKVSLVAAVAAACATAIPSQAQEALEEVLVTAQKRVQTVQDVPSSVAAFSSEMLEKSNTRQFDQLANIASGINITPSSNGFGSIIRIRGVGSNAYVPAIRPSVGIFLDDVPLGAREAAYSNMADIERIEVLKGPQATLFGKEVSSGAISLFTRRPNTDGIDAYVEGNFGNLGLEEYRVGGNLPLGAGFAVRASAYHNERDGTVRNTLYGFDGGSSDADGYRLRLLWEAGDNFTAVLGYEKHDIEAIGTTNTPQEYGDLYYVWERNVEGITDPADSLLGISDLYDREVAYVAPNLDESESDILSLHMEWVINDSWSLTSITSDQNWELTNVGINDSGFTNSDGVEVPASAGLTVGPYQIGSFLQDTGTESFTQELRLNFERDDFSSVFGAFYAETDTFSYVDVNQLAGQLGPLSVWAPVVSDIAEDNTEWALFTHNIYTIRDGLDFTFGLRYSEVEKESRKGQLLGQWGLFADFAHPLVPTTPWGDDIPVRTDTWDDITGTLKLTWWLNDEMAFYGGWDRGFKAGGHDVCKGSEPEPNCPDPFDSETADNFEVGLKGRFLDNTLVLNTAVFYQTYDDYQVEIQDRVGPGNTIQNAASVEITGAEAELQWLVGSHLLLDGNISYVDARWDEYEDAGCLRPQYEAVACSPNENGDLVIDMSGERLNFTSPWTANLNATWTDEFSNGWGWYARAEWVFRDDQLFFPDGDPDLTAPSYSLFNASLGLSGTEANWDVVLWVKNLADEEYIVSGSRNRDANQFPAFAGPAYEGYRMIAGLERTYGLTLKYRWQQ